MDRKEPLFMEKAGGLCEGNGTAQQIIQHHKAIHTPLQFARFQPGGDQAQVQRNAAQLKGKIPPGLPVVHNEKVVEQLLEQFTYRQHQTCTEQNPAGSFVAHIPQLPGGKTADRKTDEGVEDMERAVRGEFLHRPVH